MSGGTIKAKARRKLPAFALCLTPVYFFLPAIRTGHAQKLPRPIPVDGVICDLCNPNRVRRNEAATPPGTTKIPRAIPELVDSANNPDPAVRREIMTALEKLADAKALPAFVKLCGDPEKDIRERCIRGIVGLCLPKDGGLSVTLNKVANFFNPWADEWADLAVEPGTAVDPTAVSALAGRLRDPDEGIRAKAARALGILKGRAAVSALVQTLHNDNSSNVRFESIRSLRKISDATMDRELFIFSGHDDPKLRNEAIFTLGRFRFREAVTELERRFEAETAAPAKDQDNTYRQILMGAISSIGERRSECLFLKKLQSKDDVIRQHAFAGLARTGNTSAVTDVSRDDLSSKHPKVKVAQAYALFQKGRKEYLDEIARGLDSRRTNEESRQYLHELTPTELPEPFAEVS